MECNSQRRKNCTHVEDLFHKNKNEKHFRKMEIERLIHSDICGPMRSNYISGARHFITNQILEWPSAMENTNTEGFWL